LIRVKSYKNRPESSLRKKWPEKDTKKLKEKSLDPEEKKSPNLEQINSNLPKMLKNKRMLTSKIS